MKKNLFLVSILAAAMSMAACDDKEVESHSEGAVRCNVNSAGIHFAETWKNGAWSTVEMCSPGNTCVDGRCLSTDLSCNDVTFVSKCVALPSDRDVQDSSGNTVEQKSLLQYCSNGQIRETNCRLQGQVCLEGEDGAYCGDDSVTKEIANAECSDGETRCNINGEREVCGGTVWRSDPCPTGKICAGGKCSNPDAVCRDGATKCDGKDAYVCNKNVWEKTETCAEKCFAGACVASNYLPGEGDACGDIDVYCEGTTFLYCGKDDVIHVSDCSPSDGNKCLTESDGSQTCGYTNDFLTQLEVPTCSYEGQIVYVEDYSEHYEGTFLYLKCVKNADDGKLYAVDDLAYSVCDGNNLIVNIGDGSIDVRTCEGKCVDYPNHSAAQCEINGKRAPEPEYGWCTDDRSECSLGVDETEKARSYSRCTELDNECQSKFGEDYFCVVPSGSNQGMCIESCKTGDTDSQCNVEVYPNDSGKLEAIGYTANMTCTEFSDGKKGLIVTSYDICKDPATVNNNNNNNYNNKQDGACDAYDCTAQYGSECAKQYGVSGALCDGENAYCLEHDPDYDNECSDGETAWFDSTGNGSCVVVGKDESCLDGNNNEQTEYDWQYAGDTQCCADDACNSTVPCSEVCAEAYPGTDAVSLVGDTNIYCMEKCTKEGEAESQCVDDSQYAPYEMTYTCSNLSGHLLSVPTHDADCDSSGCKADHSACVNSVEPQPQPESCEYESKCVDSSTLAYCYDLSSFGLGVYAGEDACGDGYVCTTIDGADDCYEKCTDVGSVAHSCEYDEEWDEYTFVTKSCVAAGDGNYYTTEEIECANGCDENGCIKLVDNEGEECKADEFAEHCENNVGSYCAEGEITAYNCNKYDAQCVIGTVNGSPYVECKSDEDETCDTVGDIQTCFEYGFYGDVIGSRICTAFDNGKNYYVVTSLDSPCDGVCSADGKSCEEGSAYDWVYAGDEECCADEECEDTIPCSDACAENYPGSVAVSLDGDTEIYCMDACSNAGESVTECVDSNSNYDPYEITYSCLSLSGHLVNVPTTDKDCDNGCNTDHTACAGGVGPINPGEFPTDGASCTDADEEICDAENDRIAYCTTANKWKVVDCAGESCAYIPMDEDYTAAQCLHSDIDSQCKEEEDEISYCVAYNESISYESSYYCISDSDGNLVGIDMFDYGYYDICDSVCDTDGSACVPADPTVIKEVCDADEIAECVDNYGDDYTCVVDSDGYAECAEICDTVGDTRTQCVDGWFSSGIVSETCAASADGSIKAWTNAVDGDACVNGCDEEDDTKCADPLVSDQGKSCTADNRPDRCDGNILSYCAYDYFSDSYYVDAISCGDTKTCAVVDKNGTDWADCFSTSDECSTVGNSIDICNVSEGEIDTKVCRASKVDGGKNYYVTNTYSACANGCEEGASECAALLVPNQGGDCTAAEYPKQCIGNVYTYCYESSYSGNSIKAKDCAKSNMSCLNAAINGEDNWGCFETCTDVGATIDKCDDSYGPSSYYVDHYSCVATDNGNILKYDGYDKCSGTCSSEDNDISGCGLGPVVDNTMNCAGKTNGQYCAVVDGDVTAYICEDGAIAISFGVESKSVCDGDTPKCIEDPDAIYPKCSECAVDTDCGSDKSCVKGECKAGGEELDPVAICAADTNDDAYCVNGTTYVQCKNGAVDEVYDCSTGVVYSGTACVPDDYYGASCGCKTNADCVNASNGKACIESYGTYSCGCETDDDCNDGESCSSYGFCN